MSFLHREPSGVSERAIYQSAVITEWTELDPWGAQVYAWDPYSADPEFTGGRGEGGPVYPGLGDVSLPSTGCTADGLYMPCDMANRLLGQGAAVEGPRNGSRYNWTKVRFEFFRAFADGYSGYLPADAQYSGGGRATRFSHFDYTSVKDETGAISGKWHPVFDTYELNQQNPAPFDRERIKELVTEALGKGSCAEFAKSILNAVNSKKNPALAGGDLAKIFETFLATGGDYTREMPRDSAGHGNPIGNILDKGGARIYLTPATGLQAAFDAQGTIAELFHLAGSKKHYGDRALARAARAIPGYAALADERLRPQDNIYSGSYKKGPKESREYGYSIYFHTIQRIMCPVRGLS